MLGMGVWGGWGGEVRRWGRGFREREEESKRECGKVGSNLEGNFLMQIRGSGVSHVFERWNLFMPFLGTKINHEPLRSGWI